MPGLAEPGGLGEPKGLEGPAEVERGVVRPAPEGGSAVASSVAVGLLERSVRPVLGVGKPWAWELGYRSGVLPRSDGLGRCAIPCRSYREALGLERGWPQPELLP